MQSRPSGVRAEPGTGLGHQAAALPHLHAVQADAVQPARGAVDLRQAPLEGRVQPVLPVLCHAALQHLWGGDDVFATTVPLLLGGGGPCREPSQL